MEQGSSKRSGLFLLELIVAILFFALASAVCVQIYVGARVKSREAENLNRALIVCQNTAENLYFAMGKGDDPLLYLSQNNQDYLKEEDGLKAYFAKDWTACPPEDAVFTLTISSVKENSFTESKVEITELSSNKSICSLPVARYVPK